MVDLLNKPRIEDNLVQIYDWKAILRILLNAWCHLAWLFNECTNYFILESEFFFFLLSHIVNPCQNNPCNIRDWKQKKGRDKREREKKKVVRNRLYDEILKSIFNRNLFGDSSTKRVVTLGSKSFRNRAISDPLIAHQTYNFPAPTWPASICRNTLCAATIEHPIEKLRKGG